MTLAEHPNDATPVGPAVDEADGAARPNRSKRDATTEGPVAVPRSSLPRLDPGQRGPAAVWAVAAIVWIAISAQALVRWVLSEDFAPAPLFGPDVLADWRLVALRTLEFASVALLAAFLWFCVVKPWREHGRLSLDGKFVIGGIVAFVGDAFLNSRDYLFAWNANNIDVGVWTRFLPFHNPDAPSRYAESMLWGAPMYVYFCAGVAIMSAPLVTRLRTRNPNISMVKIFMAIWTFEFCFDFVVENLIIRLTHGYAYAQTPAWLTLWAGEVHQFPIYESVLVATLGCVYTWMRLMATDDPDGLCPAERGYQRWRPSLQGPVRTLSVIGLCSVATLLVYHLPFNWLGLAGDSMADLPSYMLPG